MSIHLIENSSDILIMSFHCSKVFNSFASQQAKWNRNFSSMYSVFHQLSVIHVLAKHWRARGEPDGQIPCPREDHSLFNWKENTFLPHSQFCQHMFFASAKWNTVKSRSQNTLHVCTSVHFPAPLSLLGTSASLTPSASQASSAAVTFCPPGQIFGSLASQFSLKW